MDNRIRLGRSSDVATSRKRTPESENLLAKRAFNVTNADGNYNMNTLTWKRAKYASMCVRVRYIYVIKHFQPLYGFHIIHI